MACRRGWLSRAAGSRLSCGPMAARCACGSCSRFAEVLAAPEQPAVVAVDMPIGLPERARPRRPRRGKCSAAAARRAAVVGVLGAVARCASDRAVRDYRESLPHRAEATSEPPRKVVEAAHSTSRRKSARSTRCCAPIRSGAARVRGASRGGVLAAERRAGARPSRRRSRAGLRAGHRAAPGACWWRAGLPAKAVHARRPKGAAADDLLDALACAAIARRLHADDRQPFPNPPPRDASELPMAIWA